MKAVIVGGGEIGRAIAEAFVKERHDVSIVEAQEAIAATLQELMDVQVFRGSGCDPAVLRRAGVERAAVVAVVTDSDEDNVCACALARHLAPEAQLITRIRSPRLAAEESFLRGGALRLTHVLNPEVLAARQIYHAIRIPSAVEVMEFEGGRVLLVGVRVPAGSPLAGHTLGRIGEIMPGHGTLFVARYRDGALLIPRGATDVKEGDLLYFVAKAQEVHRTAGVIGLKWKEVRRAAISGASIVGRHLARLLGGDGVDVKLIDRSAAVAGEATDELHDVPRVLVLAADPADQSIWDEENLGSSDAFAAVSRDDELNLMAALMAKRMGIGHTAVVTMKSAFIPILLGAGITTVVSPRAAAISTVLKLLRRGKILQVTETEHEDAELLEYEAQEGDRIAGKKVREIEMIKGAILGALFRGGEVIIPSGETRIEAGDRVLVFARKKAVPEVERLMAARRAAVG